MTFGQWITYHYNKRRSDHIRLGQRFVNEFVKNPWPELFYEKDDNKAVYLIENWLQDHHYFNTLPKERV